MRSKIAQILNFVSRNRIIFVLSIKLLIGHMKNPYKDDL